MHSILRLLLELVRVIYEILVLRFLQSPVQGSRSAVLLYELNSDVSTPGHESLVSSILNIAPESRKEGTRTSRSMK